MFGPYRSLERDKTEDINLVERVLELLNNIPLGNWEIDFVAEYGYVYSYNNIKIRRDGLSIYREVKLLLSKSKIKKIYKNIVEYRKKKKKEKLVEQKLNIFKEQQDCLRKVKDMLEKK